jgi:hypothetical protein
MIGKMTTAIGKKMTVRAIETTINSATTILMQNVKIVA